MRCRPDAVNGAARKPPEFTANEVPLRPCADMADWRMTLDAHRAKVPAATGLFSLWRALSRRQLLAAKAAPAPEGDATKQREPAVIRSQRLAQAVKPPVPGDAGAPSMPSVQPRLIETVPSYRRRRSETARTPLLNRLPHRPPPTSRSDRLIPIIIEDVRTVWRTDRHSQSPAERPTRGTKTTSTDRHRAASFPTSGGGDIIPQGETDSA